MFLILKLIIKIHIDLINILDFIQKNEIQLLINMSFSLNDIDG